MEVNNIGTEIANLNVKEQSAQQPHPHSFPTWEDFYKWWNSLDLINSQEVYDFFRNRVEPLERGKEGDKKKK